MAHPALDYINTAVALATFFIAEDLRVSISNVRSFFRSKPSRLAPEFEKLDAIEFLTQLVIDEELLKELSGQVSGAIDDEKQCVKKAKSGSQMDACERRAERAVCNSLNYILNRNDDKLPTKYLQDKWTGYHCERVR